MTGVNINKIRHYAPGFNSRTTRLDADAAALVFKAGNKVISRTERLIADVSIKAAMPTSPNTDGKKRGPEDTKSKQYVNYGGVVFDPKGRKTEGSYFKHYVTESERIEALRSENPVPNWGWVNPLEPGNRLPEPRTAVAKVTRYPVNPKTGEPMKTQGFEPEVKALGQTIGERNPGAKLAARAAKAMGLVIDALGKFRCPPGTFAANRFTNERGEGCFGISAEQVQDIASALTNALQAPTDRASLINSLVAVGVSAYEIRKAYKEDGIQGLASLASRAGIKFGPLVGDSGEGDASYFSTVVAKVRDVMDATKGSKERMDRARDKKNKIITDLKSKYGITETDELIALAQIFEAMGNDDKAPFGPGQFEKLFMGGSPESHKEWVIATTVEMHMAAIMRKTGLTTPDEVIKAYKDAKDAGESNVITNFIDAAIQREEKFRIGAFKEILREASIRPETYRTQKGEPYEIVVDYRFVSGLGKFHELNGSAKPGQMYIGSGTAIKGYRDGPPPGYMDLYEATGGDIDDQWRAITEELDGDEKSRRWVQTYSTDLAAENGNGWEDFGAQVGAHESTHAKQYEAILKYYKEIKPDKNFDELTNDQLWAFMDKFLTEGNPEQMRYVFGVDIEDVIEKRVDALAGRYSQVEQQNALAELALGDPVKFNRQKNVALLETLAELNANREVGLIGDNPELDEVLDAFMPMYVDPDSRPFPPGLIRPGAEESHWGPLIVPGAPEPPGGELIIPGRRPEVPIDAPGPVKPDAPSTPKRPIPGFSDSPPTLAPGAGQIKPSGRPSGQNKKTPGGKRTPRGPIDPFERERNGKVPRMIRENRFTNQDIEEHLYGEDGKGGLFAMFRSIRNMRVSSGYNNQRDREKKRILNELIDTMGVSFEDLEAMALKAQRGEPLTPEEKKKLVDAITHLRNGANEFKKKAEEAREKYRNYKPVAIDERDQWDDVSKNRANREAIQAEIEMYESLFNRVGRGVAPAVHDILTISENGPYPDRLGEIVDNDLVRRKRLQESQIAKLTPEEIDALDSVLENQPTPYLSPSSAPDLADQLYTAVDVSDSFRRHGVTPPESVENSDIDSALPVIKALDKTTVDEDMVVEIEVDIDGDTSPGSTYSLPSIQSARILDDNEPTQGLASISDSIQGRVGSGIATRVLGSKTGRKLIEKAGVDPDQADMVQLVAEMAIGFSAGGPAGLITPLARRGARDVGEKALEVMVERGFIEQSLADKLIKHGLDRIATEGLPEELIQVAEATKDKLLTEENKRRALELGSAFQERSIELADAAKEKASELTDAAKQQASELAERAKERATEITGRIGDRWKRRRDRDSSTDLIPDDPFASPPDPSTGAYPVMPSPDSSRGSGLASKSDSYSQEESREYLNNYVQRFKPSTVETKNPVPAGPKYAGSAFVKTTSYEIGGKKVTFGNPKDFEGEDIDAEIIPLNPFEISGLSKDSEEGQKAAIDWFFARVATTENEVTGSNDVEALLYAASKGDGDAQRQLEELSRRGKELTEKRKQEVNKPYTDEEKAEIASRFEAGRLPTSEDLVAVRQISYPPKFDDEGNLLLENASDYDVAVRYEADGSESKERYKPFRKSVHFTINAPVAAHPLWRPGEDDYIIVIDFAKMLEANPDSLDNLLVEDTFLTGKPGQPLKIPKGFFTYERIQGKDRGQIVSEGMKTLGKGTEFPFEIGTGGADSGTGTRPHMADALNIISQEELGIQRGQMHQSHALYVEKSIDSFTKGESVRMPSIPSTVGNAAEISLNSVLALAENLNWSDAELSSAVESIV